MFYSEARSYIEKLITMQRHMIRHEYKRIDQVTVVQSINTLESLLSFYAYASNDKMTRFWRKYRYQIRILLPTRNHPGFEKLLSEFNSLDNLANDRELEIWQSVTASLASR